MRQLKLVRGRKHFCLEDLGHPGVSWSLPMEVFAASSWWSVKFWIGQSFTAALLPLLFRMNPRSHHKGATGRVWTGDQLLPVLCHCQLGQDIPEYLDSMKLAQEENNSFPEEQAVHLFQSVLGSTAMHWTCAPRWYKESRSRIPRKGVKRMCKPTE